MKQPIITLPLIVGILVILLMLFAICGCSSATPALVTPAPAQPVDPAPIQWPTTQPWALAPGWQRYQINRGRGKFDRTRCWIDFDGPLSADEINGNVNIRTMWRGRPCVARVFFRDPDPMPTTVPADLEGCLIERMDSTGLYVGEAGAFGQVDQTEPEPMVTASPVKGLGFRVVSLVTNADGTTFKHTVDYLTVDTGAAFDGFTGCTLTCIVENPGGVETVYCQVFDDQRELAAQLYGLVNADDTISNLIYSKRVGMGT